MHFKANFALGAPILEERVDLLCFEQTTLELTCRGKYNLFINFTTYLE